MSNQGFFPKTDAERVVWMSNFQTKLALLGALCGLSTAEIEAMTVEITAYIWLHQVWCPVMHREALGATSFRNLMDYGPGATPAILPSPPSFPNPPPLGLPGILPRLFAQIARLKTHPAYTENIGRELGIVGIADSAEHASPPSEASLEPGEGCQQVRLGFTRYGHDGVHIECRRNGSEWAFLAVTNSKPYIDKRPLLLPGTPELREYRLRFWDKGQPNGEYSAVLAVTVGT